MENELGWADWDEVTAASERFWREAVCSDHRKVAWLSRRSAMEYAGFLEWLSRLGDTPCEVIDLTEVKISRHPQHGPARLAMSVGMLPPDTIRNDNLWDLAEPLQMTARGRYLDLWRQLCSENAPLRVIDGNKLVSAPVTFFDSLLLSYVNDDWQKVAIIVGQALASQMDNCTFQTGDIFLAARMNALVESGRLEIQGKSTLEMHLSEVRLPRARG
jgi:hypothetical protein